MNHVYTQRHLPYTPSPYSISSNTNTPSRINHDEEVKLSSTSAERDLYESLAELYSIIITLDALEKAYLKDSVPEEEYTEICNRLLKQYKSNLADGTVSAAFESLETFMQEWDMECPRAAERIRIGVPTSVEQGSSRPAHNTGTNATALVIASENFITFLDAIRLGMATKDSLHPLLADVIQSVNVVTDVDFENKDKIVKWLITLNQMRVSDELSEEDVRELQFDIEQAYNGFKSTLT